MRYEFFEHTADAEFKAYGKSLEEAFENAALAMFSLIVEEGTLAGKETRNISVEGKDSEALLYNFLEELLFLIDSEGFLMKGVIAITIAEGNLQAEVKGDIIDDSIHPHGEVKAVTYNRMKIGKEKDIYHVRVVVDL